MGILYLFYIDLGKSNGFNDFLDLSPLTNAALHWSTDNSANIAKVGWLACSSGIGGGSGKRGRASTRLHLSY